MIQTIIIAVLVLFVATYLFLWLLDRYGQEDF